MKALELTGRVFGRLTVIERVQGTTPIKWLCQCSCGNTCKVSVSNLTKRFKSTKSCGCLIKADKVVEVGSIYEVAGGVLKIVEELGGDKVKGIFEDGTEVIARKGNIRKGAVGNPYKRVTYGVGYHGTGPYMQHGNKAFNYWSKMLQRAYCPEYKKLHPSYEGVTVCEEWHNYQTFADWVTKQTGYGKRLWDLDKDSLVKGNKLYAPEFCLLIPQELNKIVAAPCVRRGDSPVGTSTRDDLNGQYMARLSTPARGYPTTYLGLFPTKELAFEAYKKEKEKYIKERANYWKDQIDPRAYEAFMNYEVEITD